MQAHKLDVDGKLTLPREMGNTQAQELEGRRQVR